MEVVFDNIQLEIILHQRYYKKHRNILLKELKKELHEVTQNDPEPNTNLHNKQPDLEQKLLKIEDDLTLQRCKKIATWHLLNFEKPTLAFCKLSKDLKTNDKLSKIRKTNPDETETEYPSNVERNNKHFIKIYTLRYQTKL